MSSQRYFSAYQDDREDRTSGLTSGQVFRRLFNDDRGSRRGREARRSQSFRGQGRGYRSDDGRGYGRDDRRGYGRDDRRGYGRDSRRDVPPTPSGYYGGFESRHIEEDWDRVVEANHRSGLGSEARAQLLDLEDEEPAVPSRRREDGRETRRYGIRRDYGQVDEREGQLVGLRRSKKKRVVGGRIPEFKKEQEYRAETLYCEACDEHFRDENAKGLHDRSADHKRNLQFLAKSVEAERMIENNVNYGGGAGKVGSGRNETVARFDKKQVAKFMKDNGKKFTKAFQGWANRSLKEAKKLSDKENDPLIYQSVEKEIIAEFMHHTDQCTMRHESWDRKPVAAGANYRDETIKRYKQQVTTDAEIEDINKNRSPGPDTPADDQNEQPAAENGYAAENGTLDEARYSHFVRGGVEGQHTEDDVGRRGARITVQADTAAPAGTVRSGMQLSDENEGERAVSEAMEESRARILSMNWKIRRSAVKLYHACQAKDKGAIARKTNSFAPRLSAKGRDRGSEEERLEPLERVMEKYSSLKGQYDEGQYGNDDWYNGICRVSDALRKRRTRKGTLQSCLQMQIDAAIDRQKWVDCFAACNELIVTYKHKQTASWIEHGAPYVVYWVLSLLFKDAAKDRGDVRRAVRSSVSVSSTVLTLARRMRDLPRFALNDATIHEAVQVFKAVISNNYYKFFDLYKNAMVHVTTKNRSRHMMDKLAVVVRERAVVTMGMRSCVYHGNSDQSWGCCFPDSVPLWHVMTLLRWDREVDDEGVDTGLHEARGFITSLPQNIHLGGDEADGRLARVLRTFRRAEVRRNVLVDVEMLLRLHGNAIRLR